MRLSIQRHPPNGLEPRAHERGVPPQVFILKIIVKFSVSATVSVSTTIRVSVGVEIRVLL